MTEQRILRRQRMRLEDVSYAEPSMVYFATLCARHKHDVFRDDEFARVVIESLMWCRSRALFRLYAFCLMPDHLHIAVSPTVAAVSLSASIGRFKSFTTSRSWEFGQAGQLWQRSWYDHIARKEDDVPEICKYILENPVRKMLVESSDLWPYSGMPDAFAASW